MTKTPKYAPAREDGMKPWVVTVTEWGKSHDGIVYSDTRAHAEYEAKGRMLYTYAHGRRATPADMERLS